MSFETLRFHNRKNMDVSVKFSFAGIGLMGCRVADTISLLSKDGKQIYPTLGININKGDLDQQKNLLNKLQLKCSFDAAGRDPALGSKAISQYEETIKTALKEIAKGTKFLWLIVGLGGGTGTGAIMKVASWTKQMQTIGIDFGIIFSIPREKDGFVENQNALKVLSILNEVASNRQIPLIPIDNELLFEKHLNDLQGKEYTSQANEDIAGLLHQINIITKYTPYGSRHFDGQEFYTVLKNGGCIQFSKTILNLSDFRENVSLKTKIQNSLVNGIASEGYNIQNANMAGISIFVPSIEYAKVIFSTKNVELLENTVRELIPQAEIRWGQYVDQNNKNIEIYSIMSGLGLPKSIERIPEILDKYKPNGPADKLNLNTSLLDYKNKKEISTDFVDPFEEKNLSSNLDDPFKNEESKDNSDIPSWLK